MRRDVYLLEGRELDYWVERAKWPKDDATHWSGYIARYSTDWSYGGPLVQEQWRQIRVELEAQHGPYWPRLLGAGSLEFFLQAFVAGVFGAQVGEVDALHRDRFRQEVDAPTALTAGQRIKR